MKGSISKELQAVFDYITSDDGETEDAFAKRLKDMVAEINADKERMGVVMTLEEEIRHQIRHRDREWQEKIDEKDALLEQNAISLDEKDKLLGKKDMKLSEQAQIIADLRKEIEALKANAPT